MKRILSMILIISMLVLLAGCANNKSEEASAADNQTEGIENGILNKGDIVLCDSSYEIIDYTDIDFGLECDFSFVVENQSARTLYTIGIHAVLLDDENTILGTEDAYVNATIKNGQKATANGFFYLDDYDGVKSIVADCAYYGVNDAYTVSELALDEDQISKTKLVLDDTAAELTDAEIAYNSMKNLDVSDLTETSTGKYKYNGITILSDNISEIGGETLIDQGAMYYALAHSLSAFDSLFKEFYGNLSEDVPKTIWGIDKPSSWAELEPYVRSVESLISEEATPETVLPSFEALDCVDGTFNYDARMYAFTIKSLSDAAADLGITETMLGYILAYLDEYAPDITFDGNTVNVILAIG